MPWEKLAVNSVVKTRHASALIPGEAQSITNGELVPSDLEQLHMPDSRGTWQTLTDEILVDMFFLSFENTAGGDILLLITSNNADTSYVKYRYVDGSGVTLMQEITGLVTKAHIVHRGNQYFLGTDQGNYVIQESVPTAAAPIVLPEIRAMGMSNDVGELEVPERTQSTAWCKAAGTAGSSVWESGDVVVYAVCEYDSANDVQADVVVANQGNGELNIEFAADDVAPSAGQKITIDWSNWGLDGGSGSGPVALNDQTDKMRIYRVYCGDGSTVPTGADRANEIISAEYNKADGTPRIFTEGGLLATVDFDDGTYVDEGGVTKFDPATPFPQIPIIDQQVSVLQRMLTQPGAFTEGSVFNDCLVLTKPGTSKQLLFYSPPGYPEYQPAIYFLSMISDESDEIVGTSVIGNRLVVLTKSGVHRVNYLPFQGLVAGQQGRVVERVTSRHGCVGRKAWTTVETSRGEVVVWLSRNGIQWSDGMGWSDACPDFSVDSTFNSNTNIAKCVLVNNPAKYRIELYEDAGGQGSIRWDFYYHPTLLKNGNLRMLGPTQYAQGEVAITAANVVIGGRDVLFTASNNTIYREAASTATSDEAQGPTFTVQSIYIKTGELHHGTPMDQFQVQALAMTHTAMLNGTIVTRTTGTRFDGTQSQSIGNLVGVDSAKTSYVEVGSPGVICNDAVLEFTISDGRAGSYGPIYVKSVEVKDATG